MCPQFKRIPSAFCMSTFVQLSPPWISGGTEDPYCWCGLFGIDPPNPNNISPPLSIVNSLGTNSSPPPSSQHPTIPLHRNPTSTTVHRPALVPSNTSRGLTAARSTDGHPYSLSITTIDVTLYDAHLATIQSKKTSHIVNFLLFPDVFSLYRHGMSVI
jgi:hypothetical protein